MGTTWQLVGIIALILTTGFFVLLSCGCLLAKDARRRGARRRAEAPLSEQDVQLQTYRRPNLVLIGERRRGWRR
jgi:hypothetical protein